MRLQRHNVNAAARHGRRGEDRGRRGACATEKSYATEPEPTIAHGAAKRYDGLRLRPAFGHEGGRAQVPFAGEHAHPLHWDRNAGKPRLTLGPYWTMLLGVTVPSPSSCRHVQLLAQPSTYRRADRSRVRLSCGRRVHSHQSHCGTRGSETDRSRCGENASPSCGAPERPGSDVLPPGRASLVTGATSSSTSLITRARGPEQRCEEQHAEFSIVRGLGAAGRGARSRSSSPGSRSWCPGKYWPDTQGVTRRGGRVQGVTTATRIRSSVQGPEPVLREQAALRSRYDVVARLPFSSEESVRTIANGGAGRDIRRRSAAATSATSASGQRSTRTTAEKPAATSSPRRRAAVRFTNTINAVAAELVERQRRSSRTRPRWSSTRAVTVLGRHVDLARVQAEVVLAGVLVPPDLCGNQISGGPSSTRRRPRDCVCSMAMISTRRQTRPCKTRWWTAIAKCLAGG